MKRRTKLKRIEGDIEAQRDQMFIWRCFGDALAFAYLDPFGIKSQFFDTDDYSIKKGPGSLSGKKGLKAELESWRF